MQRRSISRVRPASGFIEPCIPTPAKLAPVGPDWVYEIKHNGYRLMVRKDDERVRVYPFWQRVIYHAKRFYEVLRHAATVISIAFACFNIWQFVDDT